jgi:uncharacterized protein (DUF305 family)
MMVSFRRALSGAGALACAIAAACTPAARQAPAAAPVPATTRVIHESEVEFMQGMIPHHAQAVLIAGWARSHGARRDVLALCERIVVGQTDEIHLMQHWLRERGQDVPPDTARSHKMKMNGMVHDMLMPGMLNAEQLAALDRARGSEWDRLFLEAMIAHHAGAIDMVNKLMSSPGGATDDLVYRFSADVYADQTTEIERMQKMLAATPGAKP